jgi:hypothetical protein
MKDVIFERPNVSKTEESSQAYYSLNQGLYGAGGRIVLTIWLPHPPGCFSQVFILKGVKVVCFDRLSQVWILKDLRGRKIVGFIAGRSKPTCTPDRVWDEAVAQGLGI